MDKRSCQSDPLSTKNLEAETTSHARLRGSCPSLLRLPPLRGSASRNAPASLARGEYMYECCAHLAALIENPPWCADARAKSVEVRDGAGVLAGAACRLRTVDPVLPTEILCQNGLDRIPLTGAGIIPVEIRSSRLQAAGRSRALVGPSQTRLFLGRLREKERLIRRYRYLSHPPVALNAPRADSTFFEIG
jgi:hypothetical protein